MFGGGSRVVQEEQQIKRAEEASKVRPKNLNNLINLAKEEYKNNGEKEKVWKTSQEGWVVSYGRILTPTGEQNEFAKPEVRVYSPIQALKMSRTDPLLYAFLASNLPAIIGPVGAPKSTIGSQFSPRSQIYRGLRSPSSSSRQYLEPISPAEPPPPIIRPGRKITKSGSTRLTPEQLTRYQRSILETGGTATSKPTIDEFKQLLEMMFRAPTAVRAKGGTIPALFAGGGTVGGPGALGVDSVPAAIASGAGKLANYGKALLAPGEEVINTRASMLFRPLLKDINDNAARLWQSFTNAVRRQADVNAIKNGIIQELNKILGEFRELLDKESNDIKRKGRLRNTQTPPPGGGTLNSRRIPSSTSSPIKTSSQNIQPMKMPKVDMTVDNSKIVPQPQQKITPPQISTIEPKVTISNPIDITQKIVEPSIKVPFMEKTFVDNTKMYIVPVKETSSGAQKYEISKQKPSINYITLPTKTVNLGSTGSKPSAPSSSSGTSVPSISPIDQSNDYVFTTPSMYGILVV
jgi:hypothetical protein